MNRISGSEGAHQGMRGATSKEKTAGKREGMQSARAGKGGFRAQRTIGDGSRVGLPLRSTKSTASS